MAAAPARRSTSLQAMFPESKSGKIIVFARPATALAGAFFLPNLGNDRSVGLKLAIGRERGSARFQRLRRLDDLAHPRVVRASFR